jgi:hypothetical protein
MFPAEFARVMFYGGRMLESLSDSQIDAAAQRMVQRMEDKRVLSYLLSSIFYLYLHTLSNVPSQGKDGHCARCRYCWHSSVVNERVTRDFASAIKSSSRSREIRAVPSELAVAMCLPSELNATP